MTNNKDQVGDSSRASNKKQMLAFSNIFVKTPTTATNKNRHKVVRDSSDYTRIQARIAQYKSNE